MARVWPLSIGGGTLAASRAPWFQTPGVTYALNEAARVRGFTAPDPIQLSQHRPPSNPLGTVKQEVRMRIFADARACGGIEVPRGCWLPSRPA